MESQSQDCEPNGQVHFLLQGVEQLNGCLEGLEDSPCSGEMYRWGKAGGEVSG